MKLDSLLAPGKLDGHEIKVVLYDQLCCGKSERPRNTSIFRAHFLSGGGGGDKTNARPRQDQFDGAFVGEYAGLGIRPEVSTELGTIDHYGCTWGPNEFTVLGNLKDLDITPRLPEIRVPALVSGGRCDEVTPRIAETIHNGIRGWELVTFEKSAHLPMWEEQEKYLETVREFILS